MLLGVCFFHNPITYDVGNHPCNGAISLRRQCFQYMVVVFSYLHWMSHITILYYFLLLSTPLLWTTPLLVYLPLIWGVGITLWFLFLAWPLLFTALFGSKQCYVSARTEATVPCGGHHYGYCSAAVRLHHVIHFLWAGGDRKDKTATPTF